MRRNLPANDNERARLEDGVHRTLAGRSGPVTVREVTREVGLHPNAMARRMVARAMMRAGWRRPRGNGKAWWPWVKVSGDAG